MPSVMLLLYRTLNNRIEHQKVKAFMPQLMVAALYFCLVMACIYEENTKVSIDGNNPPRFKLEGSGHQMFFLVSEIPPENQVPNARQNPDRNVELWDIEPNPGTAVIASNWPEITYGKVPPGFRQKTPTQGEAPKLVEGKVYGAGGLAYGANGGGIWFSIRDGKSAVVQEPSANN